MNPRLAYSALAARFQRNQVRAFRRGFSFGCGLTLALSICVSADGADFTLQVGIPPEPPTRLVHSEDQWHWRKGTNAPVPGWQTRQDATLDASWSLAPGGFGFAAGNPGETRLCGTVLTDMYNRYSTLYVRRTFEIAQPPAPEQRLLLTMDWDDGFVAYLDGVEIQRSNAPGAESQEPPFNALATRSHESSNGNPENSPQPPTTFDLGPVGNRLGVGPHVLAVMGLNAAIDSSDFIMLAGLSLTGSDPPLEQEGWFTLVETNSVLPSGTNSVPNSAGVLVNGRPAAYNLANGHWSTAWTLQPGMNRLFVAAVDAQGNILCSTNRDIISALEITRLAGVVSTNAAWGGPGRVIRVTNDVSVGAGCTLTLAEGTVVLLEGQSRMEVAPGGLLLASGTVTNPIVLLRRDELLRVPDFVAGGPDAGITLRHVESVGCSISASNGASLLIEDSLLRDLPDGQPIVTADSAAGVTLRRTHLLRTGPVFARQTPFLAEGSLAEEVTGSASDLGGTMPPLPSWPRNLAALTDGTNQLILAWQDASENEEAFVIERSTDGANWIHLGEAPAGAVVFADPGAALGQRYFYRVAARNATGWSRWSNIAGGARQTALITFSGALSRNLVLSPLQGTLLVSSNVVVPTNTSLTLLAGTRVQLQSGASIIATAGGSIHIAGEAGNAVILGPSAPGELWGQISAVGPGASLVARYADISAGQTTVYSNAVGRFEDCYFHDFRRPGGTLYTSPLVLSSFAAEMTLRRCHLREYYETLFRDGVIFIEDCLFEYVSGDALDFDGAQPGTILRRSTFRHGTRSPSNIDAVDIGPGQSGRSRGVLVDSLLIYNFPTDKGISIGDAPSPAADIIVRNCLIFDCFSGVQVKDNSVAEVSNCTIVGNRWGFTNYNKLNPSSLTGGGHITNAHNNILWDNGTSVTLVNGSTLTADHNDIAGILWPGDGNFTADPEFVNPAERDYRLGPNSACRGAGRDGADLGAAFPVGAAMAPSHPRFVETVRVGSDLVMRFRADPERTYRVETSASLEGPWTLLKAVPGPELPALVEVRDGLMNASGFYRITGGF